jgi:hypothetical protein
MAFYCSCPIYIEFSSTIIGSLSHLKIYCSSSELLITRSSFESKRLHFHNGNCWYKASFIPWIRCPFQYHQVESLAIVHTHAQGQSLQTTLNPGILALLIRYCSIGWKSSMRWNLLVPPPFSSFARHWHLFFLHSSNSMFHPWTTQMHCTTQPTSTPIHI